MNVFTGNRIIKVSVSALNRNEYFSEIQNTSLFDNIRIGRDGILFSHRSLHQM